MEYLFLIETMSPNDDKRIIPIINGDSPYRHLSIGVRYTLCRIKPNYYDEVKRYFNAQPDLNDIVLDIKYFFKKNNPELFLEIIDEF